MGPMGRTCQTRAVSFMTPCSWTWTHNGHDHTPKKHGWKIRLGRLFPHNFWRSRGQVYLTIHKLYQMIPISYCPICWIDCSTWNLHGDWVILRQPKNIPSSVIMAVASYDFMEVSVAEKIHQWGRCYCHVWLQEGIWNYQPMPTNRYPDLAYRLNIHSRNACAFRVEENANGIPLNLVSTNQFPVRVPVVWWLNVLNQMW